jgi:hypothetical protein
MARENLEESFPPEKERTFLSLFSGENGGILEREELLHVISESFFPKPSYVSKVPFVPVNLMEAGFGFFPIENSRFPTATLPSFTFSGKTPSLG